MSKSFIAIEMGDGSIKGIYCHSDGYPDCVGKLLIDHYADPVKVERLLALGDISCLEENISPPEGSQHSFDCPCPSVTIAYHRDRGEAFMPPTTYSSLRIMKTRVKEDLGVDFAYVLKSGSWQIHTF